LCEFLFGSCQGFFDDRVLRFSIDHAVFDDLVDAFVKLLELGFKNKVDFFVHFLMSAGRQPIFDEHVV
jgi:hypothetical protein